MTIEEFLAEASLIMHPRCPKEVALGDVLDALRELYPLQEALEQAEHEKRMWEQELRDRERGWG